ncbi:MULTISPECIES: hypothetical protein [unclassified Herbaspirillum]|uniref:hypothetical protein n=1 Tax=unclassified Herbaspirillum TaxID=2624150 RepID=UPI0018F70B84|nr:MULTISPECIES: hypothetical protein [unclassified Herbaspirillum]
MSGATPRVCTCCPIRSSTLYDGAEPAKAIVSHTDDIEAGLHQFEQAMFERSAKVATEGEKFYELLAGEDPAQGMINMFQDAATS